MTQGPTTQDESILDLFEATTDVPAPAGPGGRGPSRAVPVDDDKRRRRRRILALLLAFLLLVAAAIAAWYALNRKPLTQLPGVSVVQLPTYKTSLYNLEKPLGVAVTPDGAKVFASHGGAQAGVTLLDRDGRVIRELEFPTDVTSHHTPVYLAVAPDGKVYVGDRTAGTVYIFDADGQNPTAFAPKDAAVKFSPLGVAVGRDGTLYVADVGSTSVDKHRILVFAPDGTLTRTLGEGKLNYPNQLAVDAAGNVYATDSNAGRFVVINPAGEITTLVSSGVGAGDVGLPRGFGIDDRGRLFIVDTTDHQVRMYVQGANATDRPTFQGSFGDAGVADGQFQYPNGLAVDSRARIYIADRENNRIQVWGF